MATPGIKSVRLTDARFLVGPKYEELQGWGDDMFSLTPASDTGSAVQGALGDVMYVRKVNRLWNAELTFLQAGVGIDLLLQLDALLGVFPLKCEYGDFNFVGFMQIRNPGALTAGLGATTRVISADCTYVSGNVAAAPGFTLVLP